MKRDSKLRQSMLSFALLAVASVAVAPTPVPLRRVAAAVAQERAQSVNERDVRAHLEFLASDAMQGRGSGTQFELLAGQYVASQLRQFGVEPAGDAGAGGAGQKSF